jgi:hypothetical protein
MFKKFVLHLLIVITLLPSYNSAEQINIGKIEQMPNKPYPYEMRSWKEVAIGYDSLTFNINLTGQYLPLISIDGNSINYPEHNRFWLHTAVGAPAAEAINVLPAVVGATLVGIDKSSQNSYNWVLMCEEFFNKRPEENIYLNNYIGSSGSDWWYDTMPNVFFYQLYHFYPGIGDFDYQFITVADQWLKAVEAMGGSTTPWHKPYMNYRGWCFSTMTPNYSNPREPEAAGAIAWILYNAFIQTSDKRYRIGAEWSMEFLDGWTSNPSYELQLPYGAYIAARMNAELGTTYNIEKLVNWCFDVEGNVRNWGATLGNWGGYDCYGLIGEAKDDGYAFLMNGFEQVGVLVPMVRYDDRFAQAIGKWVLNIANASRLFYTNFLPDSLQDSEEWSHQYDPNSYIGHEALCEFAPYSGISPFATGDFIRSGWGPTNLTLYSSSHVGILGGIVDTTNVEMILKLDALKTDYYHNDAYPTYLYFNPYEEEKVVEIEAGSGIYDLYNAVNNSFLKTYITGLDSFPIPQNSAALITIVPSGGELTYQLNKTLLNGIVIDYNSGQTVENYPPRIKSLAADTISVIFTDSVGIYCVAEDRDNDELNYEWNTSGGVICGEGENVIWIAPEVEDNYIINCIVNDGQGGYDSDTVFINVVEYLNRCPIILELKANPKALYTKDTTRIACHAYDPDGDTLNFVWIADHGSLDVYDSIALWVAPDTIGQYYISCKVSDGRGGEDIDSVRVIVRDTLGTGLGFPVGFYSFNGNANDESGFGNHGIVYGAILTEDRFGNANSAYYLDGENDWISIPNCDLLNFQEEITVSFWIMVNQFFQREQYPISHGNWENRWKVSITNEKIRWTVKTTSGIKNLDSQTSINLNEFYHVVVIYDGHNFQVYVNGNLDASSIWSGSILQTTLDLSIGQHLPNMSGYNFKGVIDDVRIYDYALTTNEIENLYYEDTEIISYSYENLPDKFFLYQNCPNPFNPTTTIRYELPEASNVKLQVFDLTGRLVETLVDENQPAGEYLIGWNAQNVSSGIYFYRMQTDGFTSVKKCVKLK